MLISKRVTLSWMPLIKEHYVSKGYVFTKYKEKFEVKVEDLHPNSQARIRFACDYCSVELENSYHKYHKSLSNFPPVPKVCCAKCRYTKNKEVLHYKNEHNLLNESDSGYFSAKQNRIAFIKEYIERNGDLKNLTATKDGWKIIRFQNRYKDDLSEIVEDLGHKYYEMVSSKLNYYSEFSTLEKNIRELIQVIGRFPSYDELRKELKCTDQFIAMHGGIIGILNKMGYKNAKELIDDSGYVNQSTYEYIVAQFLLNNDIPFKRNQNPFPANEKNFMSDFAIYPNEKKEVHIEVWGLGTDEYKRVKQEKMMLYKKYSHSVELISLEKSLFRKKYDHIQETLINRLGHLLQEDLLKVDNEHIVPQVWSDQEIIDELLKYSDDSKTLPKYETLREVGKTVLFDEAVKRSGSYMSFAAAHNLKTHGKRKGFWTEEEAFRQMKKVGEIYGSVHAFISSRGSVDKDNTFKGLVHYVIKTGEQKTKLNYYQHCLENGIPIQSGDVLYLQTLSKRKHEKHFAASNAAKWILSQLNEI